MVDKADSGELGVRGALPSLVVKLAFNPLGSVEVYVAEVVLLVDEEDEAFGVVVDGFGVDGSEGSEALGGSAAGLFGEAYACLVASDFVGCGIASELSLDFNKLAVVGLGVSEDLACIVDAGCESSVWEEVEGHLDDWGLDGMERFLTCD